MLFLSETEKTADHGDIDKKATLICAAYQLLAFSPSTELPSGCDLSTDLDSYPHRFQKTEAPQNEAVLGWVWEHWNMALAFVDQFFIICDDRSRDPFMRVPSRLKNRTDEIEWRHMPRAPLEGVTAEGDTLSQPTSSSDIKNSALNDIVSDLESRELVPVSTRPLDGIAFHHVGNADLDSMLNYSDYRVRPSELQRLGPESLAVRRRKIESNIDLSMIRFGDMMREKLSQAFQESISRWTDDAVKHTAEWASNAEDPSEIKEWENYARIQAISWPCPAESEPGIDVVASQYGFAS